MSSTCLAAVLSFAIASAGLTAPDLGVWVEPTAKKVFQDSPPGAVREIDLAAARGEWESAQVVLRTADPATVRVEVGELKGGEDGASLPAGAVQIRRVAYVPVPYAGKAWPDPLIPVDAGTPIALPANENVPLLMTVRVPRDARPGLYRGEVRISGGSALVVVPVALRVWPFEIPVRPSVQTAFGLSMEFAWKFEGVAPGTPEARAMHERYWRMLVDHRISPYEIPVDILDPDAGRFLDDPGLTSFLDPVPGGLGLAEGPDRPVPREGMARPGVCLPLGRAGHRRAVREPEAGRRAGPRGGSRTADRVALLPRR